MPLRDINQAVRAASTILFGLKEADAKQQELDLRREQLAIERRKLQILESKEKRDEEKAAGATGFEGFEIVVKKTNQRDVSAFRAESEALVNGTKDE